MTKNIVSKNILALKAKHCRIWKILYFLKADEDEFGDHEGEGEEENLDLDSASISAFQMEPHVKEVLRYVVKKRTYEIEVLPDWTGLSILYGPVLGF